MLTYHSLKTELSSWKVFCGSASSGRLVGRERGLQSEHTESFCFSMSELEPRDFTCEESYSARRMTSRCFGKALAVLLAL